MEAKIRSLKKIIMHSFKSTRIQFALLTIAFSLTLLLVNPALGQSGERRNLFKSEVIENA